MTRQELIDRIKAECVDLSGQSVEAAHYIINNSDEIPYYSMREIARRANLQPVSFVRLAQKLGYPGYGELRQLLIDTHTESNQRDQKSTRRNEQSAKTIIAEMSEGVDLKTFIDSFFTVERTAFEQARTHLSEDSLERAVEALALAPRVFVIGRRTAFSPAFTLYYSLQKARPNITLLDTPGGAPEGALDDIRPEDVFVAVTFAPFNKLVHDMALRAADSGAQVIAITDSFAAPISKINGSIHFVAQSSGLAFPESALGAISIVNLLAVLTINRLGDDAWDRIRKNEQFLVKSGEYILSG